MSAPPTFENFGKLLAVSLGDESALLTTQAQRPGPRDATIAIAALMPVSLPRMVRLS